MRKGKFHMLDSEKGGRHSCKRLQTNQPNHFDLQISGRGASGKTQESNDKHNSPYSKCLYRGKTNSRPGSHRQRGD